MNLNIKLIPILVSFLMICACENRVQQGTLTPEQAAEARRTIIAWLECSECIDGELEAVAELGEVAVPSLIACLRGGPSRANREILRHNLLETYRKLKEYEKNHPESKVPMSEERYMKIYMDDYIAQYQIRAAEALSVIGGTAAKEALQEALKSPLREDVKSAIQISWERLQGI